MAESPEKKVTKKAAKKKAPAKKATNRASVRDQQAQDGARPSHSSEARSEDHGATKPPSQEPSAPQTKEDFVSAVMGQAKTAAYTAVGFGIMANAKLQSNLRKANITLPSANDLPENIRTSIKKADIQVENVISKVEQLVESYEDQLPEKASALVKKTRTTGQDLRKTLRTKFLDS